jgi:hypothetical protein
MASATCNTKETISKRIRDPVVEVIVLNHRIIKE